MRDGHLRFLVGAALCGSLSIGLACQHLKPSNGEQPGGAPDAGDGEGASDAQQTGPDSGSKECKELLDDRVIEGTTPSDPKASCTATLFCDPFARPYTPDPAVQAAVKTLVSSMSLSERADQIRGVGTGNLTNYNDIFRTPDNAQKKVRGFLFRDGPNGVNLAAQLPQGKNGFSTAFPTPSARAATFDLDLEYRIGVAAGDETVASGNNMLLAPAINVLRHPAWGRSQETYGEDPYLLGRMGTAFTVGVQEFVPACVKHYAANNIENGRGNMNSQMDEQTLREVYGRHFEMVVRDSGVACVMASYNLVNGKKATQNKHLMKDMLRTDMGFKGLTLSDWWAMPPGNTGATQGSLQANASEAMAAGLDLELPWAYNYQQLESITGAGRPVAEAAVTEAATRVVEQKARFKILKIGEAQGLKAPKTKLGGDGSIINNEPHIAVAQEGALKAITLLKNASNTLPIDRSKVKTIAVIGAEVSYTVSNTDRANGIINFANDVRLGDLGSGRVFPDPAKSTGPFAGIKAAAGSGINVISSTSASAADGADFVVVVAGLTPQDEGEEYTMAGDRRNFALDGKKPVPAQNDLIRAVAAKKKPMVVVLEGGSVIDMPWLADVPAVVMAWYPGMAGGTALAQLLFGDANFSGKLPVTWPKAWADEPVFRTDGTTVMDYFLGYRHFDKKGIEPLYPFGHGLSYTTYEYKNLQVPCTDVAKNAVMYVQVDITNSGAMKGDEVAFLFVSYPETKARRPLKELKGFKRVTLDPGQTKRVTFQVRVADLKYWDTAGNGWKVESGPLQIRVGSSAASLPLTDMVTVK